MKPDRWQQIERLYHQALERTSEARAAFLDEACAGDQNLRQEVESLLAYDKRAACIITDKYEIWGRSSKAEPLEAK
jgi:serine/threonine-protein kinase